MKKPAEEFLVYYHELKEWSGALPTNCHTVLFQWFDRDKQSWEPQNLRLAIPRAKTAAVELVEEASRKGQCAHNLYRLVPASLVSDEETETNSNEEEENTTMKAATKTAKKTPKTADTAELVAGRYKANSLSGQMITLLSDGKARSVAEIAKVIKPRSVENIGTGKYAALKAFGAKSGAYFMSKTEDGKIQLEISGKGPAKAPVSAKAKKAPPKAKAAKAAKAPAKKAAAKKSAAKKTATKPVVEAGSAGVTVE